MRIKALKPILCGVHSIGVGDIGDVPDKYAGTLVAIGVAEKAEDSEEKKTPKATRKK